MPYNAHPHLASFHDKRVFVDQDQLKEYARRRGANRDRLEKGLDEKKEPRPLEYVPQGSYAMATMIQSEVEHSDIDDGVVFGREALKGSRGGDCAPLAAREMVRDAVDLDKAFKTPPEVRKNCVRVFYDDQFHVDLPVYREYEDGGESVKELASGSEWVASNPEDITAWFNKLVTDRSPDKNNGRQLRRIVRLLKSWSKRRARRKLPSGFVISVLVSEVYPTQPAYWLDRDDLALLQVMRGIRDRLCSIGCKVYRPVSPRDEITSERTIGRVEAMRDDLELAIKSLAVIEQADCTELSALKALRDLFRTDHFDGRISELEDDDGGGGGSKAAAVATPSAAVIKRGGTGQYG